MKPRSWDLPVATALVLCLAGEPGLHLDLQRGLSCLPGLKLIKLVCHVHLSMPKIGQDNPTFSKQLPALPGCFDVPRPGMGGAEETPPELGRTGEEAASPRDTSGEVGSQTEQWDGWTISSAVQPGPCQVSWLEGSGQPVLPVQPPTAGGGIPGMLLAPVPPPRLTPAPLLCPSAREQLRRSRHSRTFLVESGVGELWSEMQAGRRGDGQCTPPQQTPSRGRFTGGGGQDKQESPPVLPGPRGHPGREDGGLDVPTVADPPRDPQRGPASTRGGSCRGGDTAPVCHSVPMPQRMPVRAGGVCLPPSRPTVPSKHRNVPLLPSKTSSAFLGVGTKPPYFG